jgi:signal transduction histidine kinase
VIVDDNEDEVTLTVKDNGVGLNGVGPDTPGKFGLRVARQRCAHLGGSLTLGPNADSGTILTVTLPKAAA